jgi:hypothetical protein
MDIDALSATNRARETRIWANLVATMSRWDPAWRSRVGIDDQSVVLRSGEGGPPISNEQAFEAFAIALLSGNTRWDRIERIRDQLREPFDDFRPEAFAGRSDRSIDEDIMPWFRTRRAGAAGLRSGLGRLRETAGLLAGKGRFGSAQSLIEAAFAEAGGSPEAVAMLLGHAKEWKLPGFGIALAAEALRLLGYDLCKPDRHVLRAIGAWKLVHFARWDRKGEFTAPQARPSEILATMLAVRSLAETIGVAVTKANSVIWTAGAVSGARLTNAEFAALEEA